MTGKKFIQNLAKNLDVSLVTARKIKQAFILTLASALEKGESIQLIGLGSLTVVKKAKHPYRNIQTGKIEIFPAHKTVQLRVSKKLKEVINKKTGKKGKRLVTGNR